MVGRRVRSARLEENKTKTPHANSACGAPGSPLAHCGFGEAVLRQILFAHEACVGHVAAGAQRAADGLAQIVEDHEMIARAIGAIVALRVALRS